MWRQIDTTIFNFVIWNTITRKHDGNSGGGDWTQLDDKLECRSPITVSVHEVQVICLANTGTSTTPTHSALNGEFQNKPNTFAPGDRKSNTLECL